MTFKVKPLPKNQLSVFSTDTHQKEHFNMKTVYYSDSLVKCTVA